MAQSCLTDRTPNNSIMKLLSFLLLVFQISFAKDIVTILDKKYDVTGLQKSRFIICQHLHTVLTIRYLCLYSSYYNTTLPNAVDSCIAWNFRKEVQCSGCDSGIVAFWFSGTFPVPIADISSEIPYSLMYGEGFGLNCLNFSNI